MRIKESNNCCEVKVVSVRKKDSLIIPETDKTTLGGTCFVMCVSGNDKGRIFVVKRRHIVNVEAPGLESKIVYSRDIIAEVEPEDNDVIDGVVYINSKPADAEWVEML